MNELLSEDKPEIKSYRELLVGPEAKFKDDEELAKGKYFADADIALKNKLLDEQRELILQQREQINASKSLEELLDQLKQRELANSTNTPAKEVKETKPMVTEDLKSIVASQLKQAKEEEKASSNIEIAQKKLREIYGDKATDFLRNKQEELGLSGQDVLDLAKKSPNALFNILGLNNQKQDNFQTPPRSELRNDSFKPNVEKRTWSWYKSKYKNRDFITNKDINVQMAKDAAEMGDAFYDGDFYNAYHKA